jgi:hypothetical protein
LTLPPEAQIVHAIPGRMRLRVASKKGDPSYFTHVEQELRRFDAVYDVTSNPVTASILILHRDEDETLLEAAEDCELFVRASDVSTGSLIEFASERADQLERSFAQMTEHRIHVFELVFGGLVLAALIQTLRGRFLAPATTLLSYAVAIVAFYRSQRSHT